MCSMGVGYFCLYAIRGGVGGGSCSPACMMSLRCAPPPSLPRMPRLTSSTLYRPAPPPPPPRLLFRFDLIYLVLDKYEEDRDRRLARHLIGLFYKDVPVNTHAAVSVRRGRVGRQTHTHLLRPTCTRMVCIHTDGGWYTLAYVPCTCLPPLPSYLPATACLPSPPATSWPPPPPATA